VELRVALKLQRIRERRNQIADSGWILVDDEEAITTALSHDGKGRSIARPVKISSNEGTGASCFRTFRKIADAAG